MRLDRYLSECLARTRKEVKELIKSGRITVDGEIVRQSDFKLTVSSLVKLEEEEISDTKFHYYMLHKPAGVLSATKDLKGETVLDLLKDVCTKNLFPVGRLDKDTEGLLLITDDGRVAHELLSPKKHVDKQYFVRVKGCITEKIKEQFELGLQISKEFICMPALLSILSETEALLTIREGKFHQVKRMFLAVGMEVVYLKRLSMGSLYLDETLKPGEFRCLTKNEIEQLGGTNAKR